MSETVIEVIGKKIVVSKPGGITGANGLSAYQIAVNAGFVGTEAQWLASLQGYVGADGTNGLNGGNYTHTQAIPAATWNIVHNLGYNPNVRVIDSANSEIEGEVLWPTVNTMTLIFAGAFSGTAFLS